LRDNGTVTRLSQADVKGFPTIGVLEGPDLDCDLTGLGGCLHSEGCGGRGSGLGGYVNTQLSFNGLVTSASTGQPLAGATVRVEVPARGWNESVSTDSTGHYVTKGLSFPLTTDCAGLSVDFSQPGFEPLRVTDLPQLRCEPGFFKLNASLRPNPGDFTVEPPPRPAR
jgi:hypothetical protein